MGSGKWIKYKECVRCGTAERPYFSNGMCSPCYFAGYNERNAERVKKYKRDWVERQGGKAYFKLRREQMYFDNVRELVLARDGSKCVVCGKTEKLVVHHKDRRGRNVPNPNNDIRNLETRCRSCHLKEHRAEIGAALKALRAEFWCYRWKLKACRECGRSDRKHQALGFCSTCAARLGIKAGKTSGRKRVEKTVCKWGHAMTPENTMTNKRGSKDCRQCKNERTRELRKQRKKK
jgi:5-methylcytosine-specific restriction endonuclease McrA